MCSSEGPGFSEHLDFLCTEAIRIVHRVSGDTQEMQDYEEKGNRFGVLNCDPRYPGVEEGEFLVPDQHGLQHRFRYSLGNLS